MKEASVAREEPIVAHRQPAKVAEPPDRALDDPAAAIAAQAASVLVGRLGVVRAGGNDRLDASALEEAPDGIAVVATVSDQPPAACP